MSLDDFIILVCAVAGVICFVGYRLCCEYVYLRYAKDKKRGRPGAGTSKGGKRKSRQC